MQKADGQIILGSGDYIISGEWNGTLNDVSIENRKAVLTVPADVSATTFAVGGEAHIIFSGANNTLTSGRYRSGLEVPEKAGVLIEESLL